MRIVFWQNILSLQQSAYIRALSNNKNCRVLLVVQEEVPMWRKNMGWSVPDFGNTEVIIHPDKKEISQILTNAENDSVHIFSGINAYPLVKDAFLQSLQYNITRGILSESPDWRGIKGVVRLGLGKLNAFKFQKKVDFVLAIGSLMVDWFQKSGFVKNKIYPFGYFVEKINLNKNDLNQHNECINNKFRLIFIGQLIKRKGIDILLKSLSCLEETNWYLDVIGDGQDRDYFEALSEKLKLTECVKIHGALPNEDVRKLLDLMDLLVLPSRMEGWGVVVNEALMSGVPVVCSDACGAADLIKDSFRGDIFKTESVSDLRRILAHRILQGKKTPELSSKIETWSKTIEGETAANYLLDIIKSVLEGGGKPVPPWENNIIM